MKPVVACTLAFAVALTAVSCAPSHLRPSAPVSGSQAATGPRLPAAINADSLFWRTLHAGAYDSIPRAMIALKAAYLQNPSDAITGAHIAFLHTWRLAERARMAQQLPSITDDATLAVRYFDLANKRMTQYDARTHGFSAVMKIVEGRLHHDDDRFREGMREGRESIAAWPEFNLFSIGFVLSTNPDTSALFREALDMQWRTLDLCRRGTVSRVDPNMGSNLGEGLNEPDLMKRRACYNSWIAPHNIEGFFLNMGDMVMRSGDWRTAVKVYLLARQAEAYPSWPYRELLELRVRNAEQMVGDFQGDNPKMMINSRVACSACHQQR